MAPNELETFLNVWKNNGKQKKFKSLYSYSAPNRPSSIIFLSKSAKNYEESDGVNGFDFWWQQNNLTLIHWTWVKYTLKLRKFTHVQWIRVKTPKTTKNNRKKMKIRSKTQKFSIHLLPIDPHPWFSSQNLRNIMRNPMVWMILTFGSNNIT